MVGTVRTSDVATRSGAASAEREMAVFLAVTFAVSWVVGIAGAAVVGPTAYLAGVFGPAVGALWATKRYEGSARSVWSAVARWRVAPRWYLVALALPLVVLGAAYLVARALGISWDVDEPMAVPVALGFLVFAIVIGGGPEELGWRGYLLPRLQDRWGALTASLALGAIWTLWHAPLWLLPDLPFRDMSFPLYAVQVLAMSVAYTWLFNTTSGSVLLVMLLHASQNLSMQYLTPTVTAQALVTATWVVVAVAVALRFGASSLADAPRVDRATARQLATAGR
jgi:uncharacterized protein